MRKGILQVFVANIVNLLLSIVSGFVLPKYLSVEAYGYIKTYQLYVGYVGFLHLGFVDGMYLKYGGKELENLDRKEISENLSTMKWFQLVVSVPFLVVSLINKDVVLFAFSVSIFTYNVANYYKFFYQATGEFKKYSRILNQTSFFTAIGILFALCVIRSRESFIYIFVYVITYLIVYVIAEREISNYLAKNKTRKFCGNEFVESIRSGFVLMLGNFSSILLTSMDRWFVKFLMTLKDFSYYSFAVSIQSLVDIFIQPFTITMYNFLCKGFDKEVIVDLKRKCIIFGLFIISLAFPAKFILETYLIKYNKTTAVLFLLFATQIFNLMIKGVYVNLYKAQSRQNEYFKQLTMIIGIGFVLNTLCYVIMRSKESFALATLVSTIIWYVMCEKRFKECRIAMKETFVMAFGIGYFLVCGLTMRSYIGFLCYILGMGVVSVIFMRETLFQLVDIGLGMIIKKKGE